MTSEEQKLNKCRNPWRWVCLVVAIIVPLILLVLGGVGFYLLGHKKRK